MKKFPLIILIMTIVCITSCKSGGGNLKSNIEPTPTPNIKFYPAENTVQIKGIQRAAILPFADYSAQQEPIAYREWGGNIKIMEEIIDQLTSRGITVVIQEDINSLLVDNDIIKPIDERYLINGTLEESVTNGIGIETPSYELENYPHSEDMQEELRKIVGEATEATDNQASPVLQGATVGLTKDKIIEIGQILGADIIFRGRIIDYGFKDVETNSLSYRGIGSVIGQFFVNMFSSSKDYDQTDRKNAKRSAVVQIRIYAQDTSTGDMVWTNRTEIEYTPESRKAYHSKHPKVMFDAAVKEGIDGLMGSFFSNTSSSAAAL
jgi:hypothetical protein